MGTLVNQSIAISYQQNGRLRAAFSSLNVDSWLCKKFYVRSNFCRVARLFRD